MWFLFLAMSALGGEPPHFEPLHCEGGCSFARSSPQADGFPILRAECLWPELAPEQLHRLLGGWGGHQAIWSMVQSSRIVEEHEDGALVVHVHTAPMMVDREILLRMWSEEVDGGRVFRWTRAEPQPAPQEGRVGVERDDGVYTVLREGEGVRLISTLHYDPGGSIPDALVRWFQVLGMPRFLEELRVAAGAEASSSD